MFSNEQLVYIEIRQNTVHFNTKIVNEILFYNQLSISKYLAHAHNGIVMKSLFTQTKLH